MKQHDITKATDHMFQPEIEAMPREQLELLQLERLKKQLVRVYEHIPFYKQSFDEAGFDPYTFASLDDLHTLPFTYKQDLRDAYPFGMFAVDKDEVVRVHASSGTTGQASVVGYTEHDLKIWGDLVARAYRQAGLDHESTLQISYGYGLFTGGLGAHYGGEALGCTVVPMSTGNTKRQIQLLQDFAVDGLACTPSYALLIAEKIEEMGIDVSTLPLRTAILGAEPFTNELRAEIEKRLKIDCFDIYGLSEVMGPGVASECYVKHGKHVAEDEFIIEIIDPDTNEVLLDGEWGEVVFTTLTKECSPVIRYRTRDISRIIPEKCECGRTFRRLDKIKGRVDDMLIIRGVNVFPSQIESVIAQFEEVSPYYQIVLTKEGPLDKITLEVEVSEGFPLDEVRRLEALKSKISHELKSNLQIAVTVKIVEPRTIERFEGKAKRIVDNRS